MVLVEKWIYQTFEVTFFKASKVDIISRDIICITVNGNDFLYLAMYLWNK